MNSRARITHQYIGNVGVVGAGLGAATVATSVFLMVMLPKIPKVVAGPGNSTGTAPPM